MEESAEVINVEEAAGATHEELTGLSAFLDSYGESSSKLTGPQTMTETETGTLSDTGQTAWAALEEMLGPDLSALLQQHLSAESRADNREGSGDE